VFDPVFEPIGRVKTPDQYNYPPEVPYIKFQITANEEGTDSHLKAYYRNYEPEVTISVVPEDELYPKDGFVFDASVFHTSFLICLFLDQFPHLF
jgi:hypothetical protein